MCRSKTLCFDWNSERFLTWLSNVTLAWVASGQKLDRPEIEDIAQDVSQVGHTPTMHKPPQPLHRCPTHQRSPRRPAKNPASKKKVATLSKKEHAQKTASKNTDPNQTKKPPGKKPLVEEKRALHNSIQYIKDTAKPVKENMQAEPTFLTKEGPREVDLSISTLYLELVDRLVDLAFKF
ncbi:hypothetical protein BDK51DRAFT_32553 [Blyttiomyces helicus]|uniref:Uncharacterized protein n=1 Tax=Blyttiomyces helicus TaxID=388810 RepID=A0A4P9VZZ3_9FUNG|nr:hypothetical protein BDK51DRAFT_32553 [Blyttiomyces helicus]|eukprot:RKO83860.1 hypothetical protein BDK51DRAFT_32553 [Blyttiomyces helicus]